MKKWLLAMMACLVPAFGLLAVCAPIGSSQAADTVVPSGMTYADFIGGDKVFAVQSGDVFENFVRSSGWCANPVLYQGFNEIVEAVRLGRADVAMMSEDAVPALVKSGAYDELEFLPVPREILEIQSAPVFSNVALARQFNTFLAGLVSDGTLEEMNRRYLYGLPRREDIPVIELTGKNGTLKAADTGNYPPMSYVVENNEVLGYDSELIRRFAQYLGKDVRISLMSYEGVLPSVVSGSLDMSASFYVITKERQEGAIFGDPVVRLGTVLAVKKQKDGAGTGAAARTRDKVAISPKRDYTWFKGKTVGANIGSIFDKVVADIGGIPKHYPDTVTGVEDVRNGRIAGMSSDLSALKVLAHEPGNEKMEVIPVPASFFTGPMGAIATFENRALVDEFNAFLAITKSDGTLDAMQRRWFDGVPDLAAPMPDLAYSGEKGILKVATVGTDIPFDYFGSDGSLKGYSVELANRFAARAGYAIEWRTMEFGAQIPAVMGGRVDMAISSISVTDERKQSVLFTDPVYEDMVGIIALKENGAPPRARDDTGVANKATDDAPLGHGDFAGKTAATADGTETGIFAWLKRAVQRNLITENRWKMITDGLVVTMVIAILAQALGTVFGCLLCWVLTRKSRVVRGLGRFYGGLVHGLPMVVLLMISYYILFGKTDVPAMLIAVCAFSLVEAIAIAENLKAAIDTVDAVEIEAARSLGFSAWRAFRTVTLPQAVRRALPAYCNGFVQLVKATAIVGYIAIQDLTRAGDIIRSRTYDAYFPLLLVAVIYLLMTTACIQLFKFMVKKINGGAGQ